MCVNLGGQLAPAACSVNTWDSLPNKTLKRELESSLFSFSSHLVYVHFSRRVLAGVWIRFLSLKMNDDLYIINKEMFELILIIQMQNSLTQKCHCYHYHPHYISFLIYVIRLND